MVACGWATVRQAISARKHLRSWELHDGAVYTGRMTREGLSLVLGGGSEAADTDASRRIECHRSVLIEQPW
jgi:hypothetical protein